MKTKAFYSMEFRKIVDPDGSLVPLEENRDIPFDIKRVFYIYGVSPKAVRGNHANRTSQILFIALKGACTISVDDGAIKEKFILNAPSMGLFTDCMTWKELYGFSQDCVLLALSDSYYDKNEYITDYKEFKQLTTTR